MGCRHSHQEKHKPYQEEEQNRPWREQRKKWAERQREKSLSKASEQTSREEITDQKTPMRQLAEEGAGTAQPMSSTMTSNPETACRCGQRSRQSSVLWEEQIRVPHPKNSGHVLPQANSRGCCCSALSPPPGSLHRPQDEALGHSSR